MRHPFAQLTAFAVTAFAIGVAIRHAWDVLSQGSIANYMRSGVQRRWDWPHADWAPTCISMRA